MGFFASLLPTLLQSVIGGLGGQKAPAAPVDAGVQSAMGSSAPAPMGENPVGGTGFKDLVRKGISDGLSTVVGAKVNQWKAGQAGKANRDYLDSAFPELNPWELAGASATNAGVGMSQQDTGADMQTKELATRVGMQDQQIAFGREQLAAQERMNATSAAAGVQSAMIGQGPNWAMSPYNIALAQANEELSREKANRERVESSATADRTTWGWMENIPKILMAGRSNFGSIFADPDFKSDALKANAAGKAADYVDDGIRSLASGGVAGKLGKWFSGFAPRPKSGSVGRVEPPVSGSSVIE